METTTKRACSSVPSSAVVWKYDVFLSFRGEDTRKSFTSHLYDALQGRGLKSFQDDSEDRIGNEISAQLLSAIEQSQISIIVFSQNYASSAWCLEELSKIIECKEARDAILPIFYHLDPSDVGEQIVEAFTLREEMFKNYRIDMVERWRAALKKAADLKWKHSTNRWVLHLPFCEIVIYSCFCVFLFFTVHDFLRFYLIIIFFGRPPAGFLIYLYFIH